MLRTIDAAPATSDVRAAGTAGATGTAAPSGTRTTVHTFGYSADPVRVPQQLQVDTSRSTSRSMAGRSLADARTPADDESRDGAADSAGNAAPAGHGPIPRDPVGEELVSRAASLPADHPDHAAALEAAVRHWTPMAMRLARPFRRRTNEPDDLKQVAMTALVQTIVRYDPARGDFPPYAVPTITGEIRRWLRDCRDLVRVPRRLRELDVQVLTCTEQLEKALGRVPTLHEVAAGVGAPADEVSAAARARAARWPGQLDTETVSQQWAVAYEDAGFDVVEQRRTVAPLIAALDDRSRRVLVLRYFHDMTQTEIAQQVGVSQVQVSRILSRTLDTLRTRAAA